MYISIETKSITVKVNVTVAICLALLRLAAYMAFGI